MIKKLLGKHHHAILAVDVIICTILNDQLHVYLTPVTKKADLFAFPGGLVKYQESLEDALKRHLEEAQITTNCYFEQLYTFGDPKRDPTGHIVSTAYLALVPPNGVTSEKGGWYPLNDLPAFAYDHSDMLRYAKQRLAWKLEYTNVAYSLLPPTFTLSALQTVYESILGVQLDKRNFRKKLLQADILKNTGKKTSGAANRPAELYCFRQKKFAFADML